MLITLDISIFLDNLYYRNNPPRKVTVSQPLAELLRQHEANEKLFHIEGCEVWPLDEWELYSGSACDRHWPAFWDRFHAKREFLALTSKERVRSERAQAREKRIIDLENAKTEAILAGDVKRIQMLELALILNRTNV